MTITDIRLRHRTSWSEDTEELSGTDTYRIKVDDVTDNAHTILTDSSFAPYQLFQPHPDNAAARVQSIDNLTRVDSSFLHWDVDVNYSTSVEDDDDNPFNKLPDFDLDDDPHEVDAWKDANGNVIANSAGDPYIPPLKKNEPDEIITITRNLPIFDFNLRRQYRTAINSDPVVINPPSSLGSVYSAGQCCVLRFPASLEKSKNNVIYWKATLSIAIREAGWNETPLDQGYYELGYRYEFDAAITDITIVGGNAFVVKGADKTGLLQVGDTILVSDTKQNPANLNLTNDGVYTVSGLSYTNGENVVTVQENINNGTPEFAPGKLQGPIANRSRVRIPILDDNGQHVQQQVPLDGSGAALASGTATSGYAYGNHQLYNSLPFSVLGMF